MALYASGWIFCGIFLYFFIIFFQYFVAGWVTKIVNVSVNFTFRCFKNYSIAIWQVIHGFRGYSTTWLERNDFV